MRRRESHVHTSTMTPLCENEPPLFVGNAESLTCKLDELVLLLSHVNLDFSDDLWMILFILLITGGILFVGLVVRVHSIVPVARQDGRPDGTRA